MQNLLPALVASGLLVLTTAPDLRGQNRIAKKSKLDARLEMKLAEPWLRNALWITDLEAAKATAAREGKHIFGYFTRSYAP